MPRFFPCGFQCGLSRTRLALNHRDGELKLADGFSIPKWLKLEQFGQRPGWGEDDPIHSERLERNGWVLVESPTKTKDDFGANQKVNAWNPNFAIDHSRMARLCAYSGRYDMAIDEDVKARVLSGEDPDEVIAKESRTRKAVAKSGASGYWATLLEFPVRKRTARSLRDAIWNCDPICAARRSRQRIRVAQSGASGTGRLLNRTRN